MSVDSIIARMEAGEPLRWVCKTETGRHRPGQILQNELRIGPDLVYPDSIAIDLISHPRVVTVEPDEYSDPNYQHYKLI